MTPKALRAPDDLDRILRLSPLDLAIIQTTI
jgi:hypothetical protein